MKPIYFYSAETGEFQGEGIANESPVEPGEFVLPPFATFDPVPATGEQEVALCLAEGGIVPVDGDRGAWQVKPDWRGVPLWSISTGEPVLMTLPGVAPAEIGATDIERADPTTVWGGAGWVTKPMKLIYSYSAETGEFLGEGMAYESPAERGEYLLPAFATFDPSPATGEREVALRLDEDGRAPTDGGRGAWSVKPDWRGVPLWSTSTGDPVAILRPDVTPGEIGATDIERTDMTNVWDGAGWVVDAALAAQHLLYLRARQLASIKTRATELLASLSASYPDGEVQSWAQQTREAEALAADPQASAPLLTAIAAARGLAVTELASRVLTKVEAYAAASGAIIGQRQALEDAISAVDLAAPDAPEQLAAIQWPETSP